MGLYWLPAQSNAYHHVTHRKVLFFKLKIKPLQQGPGLLSRCHRALALATMLTMLRSSARAAADVDRLS